MIEFSALIGKYFQLLIINSLIFIVASTGLYLINFALTNNKYWNKNPKYVNTILSIVFGIGTSCFGFFYLNQNENFYFLFLIIIWVLLFSMFFNKYFTISIILFMTMLIGLNFNKFRDIQSLILNYSLLGLSIIGFVINNYVFKNKNIFLIVITPIYVIMILISLGLFFSFPLNNIHNDLDISIFLLYGLFCTFSLISALFVYLIIKAINKFFKKSSQTNIKNKFFYGFRFIKKLDEINEFIFKNNINTGYIFLINFSDNNILNYHNNLIKEFANIPIYSFYYENHYFALINSNNINDIKKRFNDISIITEEKDINYFYIQYGVVDTNLKTLIWSIVNFKNIFDNHNKQYYEFDSKLLFDKYSLLIKKYILKKINLNKNYSIDSYPKLLETKRNINWYKNINVFYKNELLNIDDFYKKINNKYLSSIVKSYLGAKFIKQFNDLNLKRSNNKLIIDYDLKILADENFNINDFIFEFKKINVKKNVLINFDFFKFDQFIVNKKIIKNNFKKLNQNNIDFKCSNIDNKLVKYFYK